MSISKYFEGRTNRRDYAVACLSTILTLSIIGTPIFMLMSQDAFFTLWTGVMWLFVLILLPVTIRRMQDVGHSGFWVILAQIASLVGYPVWSVLITILLLVWSGNKDANNYGEVPVSVGGLFKPLFKAGSFPSNK